MKAREPFRDFIDLRDFGDGNPIWIRISGVPLFDEDGEFVGYRGAASDITKQKQAEQALLDAKEAAERAERAKSRFLAAASHDMRQPLHAVGLFLASLANRNEDGRLNGMIDQMEESLSSFRTMLDSLLDLTKLEAGVLISEPRDFPIDTLVQKLVAEFTPVAERKGLVLLTVPNSGIVHSDPGLIERVLRNFLANAIQYTPAGKILIGCRRRADNLEVGVWDTGEGISEDKLHDVFTAYTRLRHDTAQEIAGLGLGLAIVDHIGRTLGHPINVRSRPEIGSAFSIVLPRGDEAALPVTEKRSSVTTHKLDIDLVAVIENNDKVRSSMRVLLEDWECRVIDTESGGEALSALRKETAAPDYLIVDFDLPGDEVGLDAIEEIRAALETDIPAVIITGATDRRTHQRIRASGYPYLTKPVRPDDLYRILTRSALEAAE